MFKPTGNPAVDDWYRLPLLIIGFFKKISNGSRQDDAALSQLTGLFDNIRETNDKAKSLADSGSKELATAMISLSIQRETMIRLSLSLVMEQHPEKIGDFLVGVLNFRNTDIHKNIIKKTRGEESPSH